MESLKVQTGPAPCGRIYFKSADSLYPGWYLQYYAGRDLRTIQLRIHETGPAKLALLEAAEFLGCCREQVQLEGDEWSPATTDAG